MSPLGIVHTAVSVLPIGLGLFAFIRDGKIDPKYRVGQLYVVTMILGSVTSWGFIPSKGFTPGQALTLITLALLFAGTLTFRGRWRGAGYLQTVSLSTSYLLLMVFATTATLTRLPTGRPFASSPADPALTPVRLGLLTAFVLGLSCQVFRLRAASARVVSRRRETADALQAGQSKTGTRAPRGGPGRPPQTPIGHNRAN